MAHGSCDLLVLLAGSFITCDVLVVTSFRVYSTTGGEGDDTVVCFGITPVAAGITISPAVLCSENNINFMSTSLLLLATFMQL